jgi:hypothetical protein
MSDAAGDLRYAQDILARDRKGRRMCIPVFGTGLNIQAATMAGFPNKDDWYALLAEIALDVLPRGQTIETLPRTNLALWEALLCQKAKKTRCYPFQGENALQLLICEKLRMKETECRSFELYRLVAAGGFPDILSLNFDRRIALSCRDQRFVAGPSPCPLGSHGESLFRHSAIRHENGTTTRVWYPHGDVKKAATIKFGVRKYGFYVAVLREYIGASDGTWRYHKRSLSHLAEPKAKSALLRKTPAWVPLFLSRPLMFIGCGLSLQEWPLWWLLRRRAEIGAPPALCLAIGAGGAPTHLRGLPEVRTITFGSPGELWSAFLSLISTDAKGVA